MKLHKIAIFSATALVSSALMAQPTFEKELITPAKSVNKVQNVKTDFGPYVAEKNLRLMPSSIVSSEHVVENKNGMAIVKVSKASDTITKGTLVRNVLTGNLAPISGNITVLLNDNAKGSDVSTVTGLKLVSSYSGTKIAVFEIAEGQDILQAYKQINDSGLVKTSKIEVLEVIHQAD
jgi:hypothetical protein